MRKLLITLIATISLLPGLSAQTTIVQSLQDTVLGWTKVYHFKGYKEGKKLGDLIFTPIQLSYSDSFANWMQASYVPRAGIGNVTRGIGPKIGQYNKEETALPQIYYAAAYTWNVTPKEGKLERIPETETTWSIIANQVPATSWSIPFLCTPDEYYFTMPLADPLQIYGPQRPELLDFSKVASIKNFPYFWIKRVTDAGASPYVILAKNNKLPFIKLSKGEFLNLLEKSIPRLYEEEKKKIIEKALGNQRDIEIGRAHV